MFSKYFTIGGIATTVIGFEANEANGEAYPEPIDVTFSLGDNSSKVLLSMNLDDAKELSRAIGSAIQHVENEARDRAAEVLGVPTGEQS